jgi:hypothetical protein
VLAGAAGVGKTRLARESGIATARAVVWVTATASARGIPLGAFTPLLGADSAAPGRALHRAGELLGTARLLVVDDAHLLDDTSAALLHQLVQAGAARVIVTLRSGAPAPDAVRALWKDELLPRLEVQPLSEEETAALVGSVLGGHVDSGCRARLWSLTRGNALFLRQVVDPAALEALEDRGLVTVATAGMRAEAVLAHPLYGGSARGVGAHGRGAPVSELREAGRDRAGSARRRPVKCGRGVPAPPTG